LSSAQPKKSRIRALNSKYKQIALSGTRKIKITFSQSMLHFSEEDFSGQEIARQQANGPAKKEI